MRSTLTRAFDPIAGGKRPPEERAEDLEDEGTRGGRNRVTSGNRPQLSRRVILRTPLEVLRRKATV